MERGDAIRAVDRLIEHAVAGAGGTVVIEGAAGIGKTSLLDVLTGRARNHGMRCLQSRGGELEQKLPFGIVRQLLEPALRSGPAEILSGAAGLAAPVFNPAVTAHSIGATVHGLYWMCSNLAEHEALFITVDDAHWTDGSSLHFISHLSRRLAELPVLLALATRPGHWSTELNRALTGVDPTVLSLDPLSAAGIATLVRREFGVGSDDEFCAACAELSAGNPFLLTEALLALRGSGVDPVRSAVPQVKRLSSHTVTRSVLFRLARHGPKAELFAYAVAVLGPDAALHRVLQLVGLTARDAAAVVDDLHRDSILTNGAVLEFVHPLVRSAIYEAASQVRRAVDHKRVATMLQAEGAPLSNLVPHLLGAERSGDQELVRALTAAAADALGSGAAKVAAQCLERALAEPADAALRGDLYARLGRALSFANRVADAERALRFALERLTDPEARCAVALELGWTLVLMGDGSGANTVLTEVSSELPADLAHLGRQLKAVARSAGFVALDRPSAWDPEIVEAPGPGEGSVADRMLLAANAFAGSVSGEADSATVGRLAAFVVAGPATARERWLITNCAASALCISGRYAESITAVSEAIDSARTDGDLPAYRYLCVLRSHFWFYRGNLLEAEADARVPLDLANTHDVGLFSVLSWTLINVLIERGRLDDAEQVAAGLFIEEDIPNRAAYLNFALHSRGRLRAAQGRCAEALDDLVSVGRSTARANHVNPGYMHWRADLVQVHLAMGRVAAADSLAREEVELARRFGAPRGIGVALRGLGLTRAGAERVSLLREAAQTLEPSGADLEYARAMVDLGIALRRTGDRATGVDHLRVGMDLASRCRADALVERARAELVVAGARPRRTRRTGPDALTASERRVAVLAAEDHSNREIAQRLFVSRRTVELHLTNTFRKLGIASRRELGAALATTAE